MDGSGGQTLTGLKRWSCQDSPLPSVDKIRAIHVYDFDNTLFFSPLPNKQVWNGSSIGQLQALESISTGGWWHDVNILASTGKGADEEEKTAWEGWWNEDIVDLVRLSMQQKDAVTVLLTGRRESGFAPLISRMAKSKQLDFDMVCLKPAVGPAGQRISSTMSFKQDFLRDLVDTYSDADEIRVYEDRPKHTKAFRDFFNLMNRNLQISSATPTRAPIVADVIQVPEQATTLDPVTEIAEVQRMINTHNTAVRKGEINLHPLAIKRTVFYTGYLISPEDTERFSNLVKQHMPSSEQPEWRTLANNILITPRPAPQSIMNKVGGIGHRLTWKVTALSCFENKLWAAKVEPADPSARFYSENPTPTVVVSLRRSARPIDAKYISNWQPVSPDQSFTFETVVGEKVLLRIEQERLGEDEWESSFPTSRNQRKHPRDSDFPPLGSERNQQHESNGPRENNQQQQLHTMHFGPEVPTGPQAGTHARGGTHNNHRGGVGKPGHQGRGGGGGRGGRGRGGNRFGGGGRGSGGGGRGKGRGGGQYRSLDDNVGNYGGGGMQY